MDDKEIQAWTEKHFKRLLPLVGTATLTNTKQYPFNDSVQTVALAAPRANQDYLVQTEVLSTSGEVGDIEISGKAVNGFKIAYTGSAANAVIKYYVTGEDRMIIKGGRER